MRKEDLAPDALEDRDRFVATFIASGWDVRPEEEIFQEGWDVYPEASVEKRAPERLQRVWYDVAAQAIGWQTVTPDAEVLLILHPRTTPGRVFDAILRAQLRLEAGRRTEALALVSEVAVIVQAGPEDDGPVRLRAALLRG